MLNAEGVKGSFLEYKGRPVVRQDNEIFYGDLSKKYHVYMMIMNEKDAVVAGESVPDKIMLQLLPCGATMPEKQFIANGLADAFETAAAWLDHYNK